MSATEIQLYNTFKNTLGETNAQAAVEGIKDTVKNEFGRHKDVLATKQDLFDVKEGLQKEIFEVKIDLRKEISDFKTDLMKFMLAQTVVIIGLVVTLVKLL